MQSLEEQRLARELRAGSSQAWQTLYDAYAEQIWQILARRAGFGAADVADIVQETFLAAARSAGGYDPRRGTIWFWLCGIARNQAALHFRRQIRPAQRKAPLDALSASLCLDWLAGAEPEPAELLVRDELAAAVRQALGDLPVEYETLLAAKYIDDFSLEQIALGEGSTAAAVSSKLARARRAFRDAFAKLTVESLEKEAQVRP
jgi:RNA polymerase sigma-70 factor (ECF subfamily)